MKKDIKPIKENGQFSPSLIPAISALLMLIASCVVTYVLTFYGRFPVDHSLLYFANDPGYVAPGTSDVPVLGIHYFGDLLTQLSYARNPNPYSTSLAYPAAYPPLGVLIFKPFTSINPLITLILLTLSSVALLIYAFALMTREWTLQSRIIYISLLLLISKPLLLTIDRGNIQGIVVGLILLFYLKYRSGKVNLAVILLSLAICLKGYPLIFVSLFLIDRNYRAVIKTALLAFFISLTAGALVNPSILTIPMGMIKGDGIQSLNSTSGISFAASLYRVLERMGVVHPSGGNNEPFKYLALSVAICLTIFVLRMIIVSRNSNSEPIDFVFLTSPMFLIPVSWSYNALIVPFLVISILNTFKSQNSNAQIKTKSKIFIASCFAIILIPFPLTWSGGSRISVGLLEIILPVIFALYILLLKSNLMKTSKGVS